MVSDLLGSPTLQGNRFLQEGVSTGRKVRGRVLYESVRDRLVTLTRHVRKKLERVA